jgi:hypothetical protein
MQAQELVLRDVHVPAAPSLWPPAPGWWLLAIGVLLAIAIVWALHGRKQRRIRAWQRLFDDACRDASAAAQIAAISELLRRAARRVDAQADRLQGDDWLRFLDGKQAGSFSTEAGRVLLDGGYRRDLPAIEVIAIKTLARARFLELMAKRK